jgi:hypothetical protein
MGEFFKPWRWRAGCITLVIGCVFAAAWVRSIAVHDWFVVIESDETGVSWHLISDRGILSLERKRSIFSRSISGWYSWKAGHYVMHNGVPYWSIVLPFTLLSAWLLVNKPRDPKPTNQHVENGLSEACRAKSLTEFGAE